MALLRQLWRTYAKYGAIYPIVDKLDSVAATCDLKRMFPSSNLLKAARIALGLSVDELAGEAGIGPRSLNRVEAASPDDFSKSAFAVMQALQRRGVEFLPPKQKKGAGFRLPAE